MRKYLIFICTVLLASCLNNDFLERYPVGQTRLTKRLLKHTTISRHTPGDCMKPCRHWAMARKILRMTSRTTRQDGTSESNWIRKLVTIPDKQRQYFLELLQPISGGST